MARPHKRTGGGCVRLTRTRVDLTRAKQRMVPEFGSATWLCGMYTYDRNELLGLHQKAKQVQPRGYIAGNKRVMSIDLTARKQQKMLQTQQPRAIECAI